MKKYYLHNGTEQQGPFDLEELKAKHITKDTPIWFDGLPEWTTARKIDELKDIISASTPPPFGAQQSTPPPINKTYSDPAPVSSTTEKESKFSIWRVLQILAGLFLVALLVLFVVDKINDNKNSGDSYQQKVMTIEEIERSKPAQFLSASGTYKETFWGDKFKINCEITNKATVATYKDAVVRITYYSKTKTAIGSKEYTVYETFPPTSTKTVQLKIENFKDVHSLGLDVVRAKAN